MINVLLDANILYSASLRDIFIRLGRIGLYQAKWTEQIHQEWMDALLRERPTLTSEKLEVLRQLIDKAIPDCKISNYRQIIPDLDLPDPDDRHVLAAAISGNCQIIITQNIKDFPQTVLNQYDIEAIHPDDFLVELLDTYPGQVYSVIKTTRTHLKNPPYSVEDYLNTLDRVGLVATATKLRESADLL